MKKYLFALFTFFILVSIGCASDADKSGDVKWVENLEEGIKIAKAENKNILVNFTGSDWCIWCKRLSGEVFTQKAFKDYANKNLVLVKIDFPRQKQLPYETQMYNNNLARRYGVQGFPTIILLNSSGQMVGQSGYRQGGPESYVQHLTQVFTKS